jgi:hypothetical protein
LGEDDPSYTRNSIFAVVIFPKAVCKGMSKADYEKERRLIAQAYATYYQETTAKNRNIVVVVFDNISEVSRAWDSNYKNFMARVYKKDFALVYREKGSITEEDLKLFYEMQAKWGILNSSPLSTTRNRVYQYHD